MTNSNVVWFLGVSWLKKGLLFPNEIENEHCSSTLIISTNIKDLFESEYQINVHEKGNIRQASLIQNQIGPKEKLFSLETAHGKIDFTIKKSKNKYIGQFNTFDDKFLYEIIPIQQQDLEYWASVYDFFIVGETP